MEEWRYRELYELEERHWWFRSRRRIVSALLHRSGAAAGAPRILDAGCGTGRNLVDYARLGEAEGVDAAPEAVAFCRRRGLTGVQQSPLETLPFDDGRFGLVVATDVIEHLDDDRRALAELRRVATPGGRLVLTVPAYQWLWSGHDVSLHHRRRYTLGRLRAALGDAGWRPELGTYFFSALLPVAAAVRVGRRLRGGEADGGSDLALGLRSLNRALELPSRAEARFIARGGRLPAGLSLGLVAAAD